MSDHAASQALAYIKTTDVTLEQLRIPKDLPFSEEARRHVLPGVLDDTTTGRPVRVQVRVLPGVR
jgi:hypothetical protein